MLDAMAWEYKGFYIPKDDDWEPEDLSDFGFWMDFYIGGENGQDAFSVLVCSVPWFTREHGHEVTSGRNIIFLPRFDRSALDVFLEAKCSEEAAGKSPETTMLKIDGIGEWEYRYRC